MAVCNKEYDGVRGGRSFMIEVVLMWNLCAGLCLGMCVGTVSGVTVVRGLLVWVIFAGL